MERKKITYLLRPGKHSNLKYSWVTVEGLNGKWYMSGNLLARTQEDINDIETGKVDLNLPNIELQHGGYIVYDKETIA